MILSRLSIKLRLFVIVAIAALPALGILLVSGVEHRNEDIHQARVETQKLAESIVSEQNIFIASTRQLFIALSQLDEVRSFRRDKTQAILAEILKQSPQYTNLFVADPTGIVRASAVPLKGTVSVADRRYFRNALESGRLSSGEYVTGRATNKPTLNLGYPIMDASGKVRAVICAGLSFEYYRQIFKTHRLPRGASVAILDHAGTILYRAVEPEKYIGRPADAGIVRHMLAGPDEETSTGKSSVIGDVRVQTYRKLRLDGETAPYLFIRAGIPLGTVLSGANASLGKNLTLYAVALLCAILLAWYVAKKHIIDRVRVLQRSSQRLAEGDLSVRVAREVGGGELGMLGQAFDDMAGKLAAREQALRESRSKYQDIFNTTHDALFVHDRSGRIMEANKASEVTFGYTREELFRLSVADLISGIPPYSFSDAQNVMEKAFQEGTQQFEWLSRRRNGETFWTEVTITPTSIAGERCILAMVSDITERKEVEQMKETMLSTVGHEMRTPLTALLGFLEFIAENRVDDAQLKEYHAVMHKEAERLNDLITNFLNMQRLKARLQDYQFRPLDVRQLLEGAADLIRNPSVMHRISFDIPPDLPAVVGDETLLFQLLTNLISNAVKYSPVGSEVMLGARSDGAEITLSVHDCGIGMPPDVLDRIFDLFYRVDDPAKRLITGTGLGLAIVREIVAVHNGRIRVESVPGQGSSFYVTLPAATESMN